MAELVAKRYANAIFNIGIEKNNLNEIFEQVKVLRNSLVSDKEFSAVVKHPHVTDDEKMTIIKNVFKDELSEEVYGLLKVVFSKNRDSELVNIFDEFIKLVNEHLNITEALIVSATPLSDSQVEVLKEKISKKLNKTVNVMLEVNESLIGGVLINVDGYVIDNTISKKLSNLKKQLLD